MKTQTMWKLLKKQKQTLHGISLEFSHFCFFTARSFISLFLSPSTLKFQYSLHNLILVNSVNFLLILGSPVVRFGWKSFRTRPKRSPGAVLTPPGPQKRPETTKKTKPSPKKRKNVASVKTLSVSLFVGGVSPSGVPNWAFLISRSSSPCH